jgi:RNA polymerase sigma-70 factor (ECF subfamily)
MHVTQLLPEIIEPGGDRDPEVVAGEIDDRTLRAARRGDPDAFVHLLRHYDAPVRALAYRMLRDRVLMDDALQDAAIKAYQSLRSFRGDSKVSTWLYRITYTTCLDYLRRERHYRCAVCEDSLTGPACDDPCDIVARWADLEAALDRLSVEQRILILLVHQFGYDYRTAGEVSGVPEGTVCSRLASARVRLRGLLAEPAAVGQ